MRLLGAALLISLATAAGAPAPSPAPFPAALALPLRIVQFADLHFGEAEGLAWGPEQDRNSSRVMRSVLAAEGGAARVGLGDQITGNNVAANATAYSAQAFSEAAAAGVPFASIFGNHDDAPQQQLSLSTASRRALLAFERAAWPALSLTCGGGGAAAAAGGAPAQCPPALPTASNYYLLVAGASGAPRAVLYFLDSGGGTLAEALTPAVTDWLAATAAALAAAHGAPLPSLTFVHIPPPEYAAAAGGAACEGLADDGVTPTLGPNALLAALAAARGARAVSVGHDHGNAWCCPRAGLALCYGRHTGYGGYGEWARGARVFELAESAAAPGGVAVRTWVRMEDGSVNSEQVLDAAAPAPAPLQLSASFAPSGALDWRALDAGHLILEDAYLDQPYIAVIQLPSNASRWVATITRNSLPEGSRGEHVECLYSDDAGASWSAPAQLEPGAGTVEGLTNAYSSIFSTDFGRLYVSYCLNIRNVTHLPDGQPFTRDDTQGAYVARWSDDGGESWSSERIVLPLRQTQIDRDNVPFQGSLDMFWSVDQYKRRPGGDATVFLGFTKIGTFLYAPPEEAFFFTSSNMATERDVAKLAWDTVPAGDTGVVSAPRNTVIEETHIVPLSAGGGGGCFAVFRTDQCVFARRARQCLHPPH